jgi:hypothetical protein
LEERQRTATANALEERQRTVTANALEVTAWFPQS